MNMLQTRQEYSGKRLVVILADSFLNYLRWTQLIQLLTMFGIALLVVVLLTVISFQEQSTDIMKTALSWIVQIPGVGGYLKNAITDYNANHLISLDLKSYLLTSWVVLSLVAMLLDTLWQRTVPGERRPWPLMRKIVLVLLVCVLLLGCMLVDFFTYRDMFKGDTSLWMVIFGWLTFILFVASVCNLAVIQMLQWLRVSYKGTEPF